MTRSEPAVDPRAARASRLGPGRLHRDAGSMAVASVASAVLGTAFWAVAAKLYPPQQLGVATAILAVITAVGVVIAAGTAGAFATLIPALKQGRLRVYMRGQRVNIALSVVCGAAGGLAVMHSLHRAVAPISVGILVAIGVLVWSEFNLQNSTLVSLGRAAWLPAMSVGVCLVRIVALPALAATLAWHSVEVAFVGATAIQTIGIRPVLLRLIKSPKEWPPRASLPEDRALTEFNRIAVQSIAVAALTLGASTLTPFLATLFAGPKQGALFALCLTIVRTLDLVVIAMCGSLVVHASSAPEHGARMARAVMLRALAVTACGGVVLAIIVPIALPVLNEQYRGIGAKGVVILLCLGSVITVFYAVWAELQRSRRRMTAPLVVSFASATALFALAPFLISHRGAIGGALALLVSKVILAIGAGIHKRVESRRRRAQEATA